MELETFTYTAAAGWSVDRLPALDSPGTLVLAFGASEFFDDPGVLGVPASGWGNPASR